MIYTNTLIVSGSLGDNGLSGGSNGVLSVKSDISVEGNVFSKGRLDLGATMYMTMRASSNIAMAGSNEHFVTNQDMVLDDTASDVTSMSTVSDVASIWDPATGVYTVPVDGLYTISMQGSFSNSAAAVRPRNGVYVYFLDQAYPTSRIAANVGGSDLAYTTNSQYLRKGDRVKPTFYSSDSNAVLVGGGETFLSFHIANTFTPK